MESLANRNSVVSLKEILFCFQIFFAFFLFTPWGLVDVPLLGVVAFSVGTAVNSYLLVLFVLYKKNNGRAGNWARSQMKINPRVATSKKRLDNMVRITRWFMFLFTAICLTGLLGILVGFVWYFFAENPLISLSSINWRNYQAWAEMPRTMFELFFQIICGWCAFNLYMGVLNQIGFEALGQLNERAA